MLGMKIAQMKRAATKKETNATKKQSDDVFHGKT